MHKLRWLSSLTVAVVGVAGVLASLVALPWTSSRDVFRYDPPSGSTFLQIRQWTQRPLWSGGGNVYFGGLAWVLFAGLVLAFGWAAFRGGSREFRLAVLVGCAIAIASSYLGFQAVLSSTDHGVGQRAGVGYWFVIGGFLLGQVGVCCAPGRNEVSSRWGASAEAGAGDIRGRDVEGSSRYPTMALIAAGTAAAAFAITRTSWYTVITDYPPPSNPTSHGLYLVEGSSNAVHVHSWPLWGLFGLSVVVAVAFTLMRVRPSRGLVVTALCAVLAPAAVAATIVLNPHVVPGGSLGLAPISAIEIHQGFWIGIFGFALIAIGALAPFHHAYHVESSPIPSPSPV